MAYAMNITHKQIIEVKANAGIAFDVIKGTLTVMVQVGFSNDYMLLGHFKQGSYSDMQEYDCRMQFLLQGDSQAILKAR
jgi:hypothetical protein